jgi:hypothetical protein
MGASFCAQGAQLGLLQSASVGGRGDNAYAESFVYSLKAELTRGTMFLRGATAGSSQAALGTPSQRVRN